MRIVLKVLAVLCAVLCGLLAVVSVGLSLALWGSGRVDAMPLGGKVVIFGSFIAMASGGVYFLLRMVRHLKKPDQETARNVLVVACFLLGVRLISLIHGGKPTKARPVEYFSDRWDIIGSLAAGIALVALYKLVLKGLAQRAFPPTDPKSHA
jgi:hypothetical protein